MLESESFDNLFRCSNQQNGKQKAIKKLRASFMDAYRLDTQQFAANEEELQEVNGKFQDTPKQTGVR